MEIVSVRSLMPEKFAAMGTRETGQIPAVERLIRFPEAELLRSKQLVNKQICLTDEIKIVIIE
jgi:hypothetical protein